MRRRSHWIVLGVLVCTAAGCGTKGKLVSVSGVVRFDNKPLGGALVTFYPLAGSDLPATGRTDSDGNFELSTLGSDGVLPGEYKVTVTYHEALQFQKPVSAAEAIKAAGKEVKKPKIVIPATYSDPGKTRLRQKVPADGTVVLNVSSKG